MPTPPVRYTTGGPSKQSAASVIQDSNAEIGATTSSHQLSQPFVRTHEGIGYCGLPAPGRRNSLRSATPTAYPSREIGNLEAHEQSALPAAAPPPRSVEVVPSSYLLDRALRSLRARPTRPRDVSSQLIPILKSPTDGEQPIEVRKKLLDGYPDLLRWDPGLLCPRGKHLQPNGIIYLTVAGGFVTT